MAEHDTMASVETIGGEHLKHILEAALLAAGQPLSHAQLAALFSDDERPPGGEISKALEQLESECANRGVELKKVASGYRLQIKQSLHGWVSRLWKERPQRYSRALLETMSLIAYRQPITRGEIEAVRGVSVSTSIIRTLQEREWIRVVGHRDVPGKPALFGSTKKFLDYFELQNLDDLPTLAEIRDMESLEPELDLEPAPPAADVREQDHAPDDDSDMDKDDDTNAVEAVAEQPVTDDAASQPGPDAPADRIIDEPVDEPSDEHGKSEETSHS